LLFHTLKLLEVEDEMRADVQVWVLSTYVFN
jgi:hypothetical protein